SIAEHAEAAIRSGQMSKQLWKARTHIITRGERIFALAETCSHFSGPLAEGKLICNSIVCPHHNSRFSLEDGRVLDGPAVHPQPCLEVRVRDGQIEVRQSVARIR